MSDVTTTETTEETAATASSCCTTDGSCHSGAAEPTDTVFKVSGVHSDHCKGVVTKVVGELDGVSGVDVDTSTGRMTVTSEGGPDEAAIAAVLDDAGYGFRGRAD
ncbi:heavy-metal-associated domain-containing protein [Streptomyces sp. N2-109]|uniref:Heavy-metal-associated domain-containing protein n=1 Tax=Streptomyces gossypii TaxID=2883101 RepID=A0ABT2JNK2_9ACTN|nr:heavy-metal-associated domain-containing protein [Streptomyces gossypii]MCT2588849.1 heavy-metal-associated domain-containing protein [Streptomyces gossypii]